MSRWKVGDLNPAMRAQAEAQLAGRAPRLVQPMGPKPVGNKFGAKKVVVDGVKFGSKKEYRCFQALKLRERAGEITDLRCHVKFALFDPGQNCRGEHIGTYTTDFVYRVQGELVVADAKSEATRRTRDWPRTKALMKACHGHEVIEL